MEDLYACEVIDSDRYLGDIAEYICCHFYDLNQMSSKRHPDYDAQDQEELKKYQVKYNNSPTGNNISIGDTTKYDELLVLIGPRSKLRPASAPAGTWLIFRFEGPNGNYIAKKKLKAQPYEIVLDSLFAVVQDLRT